MKIERIVKIVHRRLSAWLAPVYVALGAAGQASGIHEGHVEVSLDTVSVSPVAAGAIAVLGSLPVAVSKGVEALAHRLDTNKDESVSIGEAVTAVVDLVDGDDSAGGALHEYLKRVEADDS